MGNSSFSSRPVVSFCCGGGGDEGEKGGLKTPWLIERSVAGWKGLKLTKPSPFGLPLGLRLCLSCPAAGLMQWRIMFPFMFSLLSDHSSLQLSPPFQSLPTTSPTPGQSSLFPIYLLCSVNWNIIPIRRAICTVSKPREAI